MTNPWVPYQVFTWWPGVMVNHQLNQAYLPWGETQVDVWCHWQWWQRVNLPEEIGGLLQGLFEISGQDIEISWWKRSISWMSGASWQAKSGGLRFWEEFDASSDLAMIVFATIAQWTATESQLILGRLEHLWNLKCVS